MCSRCSSAIQALVLLLATFFSAVPARSPAQSSAPDQAATGTPASSSQPAFTLHADSRVVLTDVTVTDRAGNLIHGLPKSAFHIFDNKQQQAISSFEEHAGVPAAPVVALPAAEHGVYSNDYLMHLPPVLNVIVLDISNLNLPDQMYLNYELTKYLKEMPGTQPLAMFLRGANGVFILQNFTTDRGQLLAALHKGIPRFPPTGREYLSDIDTLHQIAVYLSQIPGRKNVLWYSGGSTLFLREDPTVIQNYADWRGIYDELEQGRIAIFPVDARGLTVWSSWGQISQHWIMDEVARATGGHAFYNSNGLLEAASHVVDTGGNFYTVTYSPHDLRFDNKWHKVEIKVDGGAYNLSYRRGYFADGSMQRAEDPAKKRTHLLLDGEKIDEPELRNAPIIFQARVVASADPSLASLPKAAASTPTDPVKKGETPFLVRYSVPASALTLAHVDGKPTITFGIAAFAVNRDGRAVARHGVQVRMTINDESLRQHPDAPVVVDQQLNLNKGDEYLYLAVWDMASRRMGTLQIAVDVPKAGKPNHGE